MKINVLGTDYEIILNGTKDKFPNLEYGDGYCDFSIKTIVIADMEPSGLDMADLKMYEEKVIRHEIIHAFLYESGLDVSSDWARNEELIDWIALQSPKLFKAFGEIREVGSNNG